MEGMQALPLRRRVKLGLEAEESETDAAAKLGNNNNHNKCEKWLAPSVNPKGEAKEEAAAAALLFLSLPLSLSSPSSSSTSNFRYGGLNGEEASISVAGEEISSTSSLSCISDACSVLAAAEVDQIRNDPLQALALAAAAAADFGRPKLVKKARSKIQKRKRQIKEIYKMRVVYDSLNSEGNKDQDEGTHTIFSLSDVEATSMATPTAASSVTDAAAVTSITLGSLSSRPPSTKKKDKNAASNTKACSCISKSTKSINRRANAIIAWLSRNDCSSEHNIRSAVGDSPDTSKALRLLVKKEEVKRTGAGGRSDPFVYTVASKEMTQANFGCEE